MNSPALFRVPSILRSCYSNYELKRRMIVANISLFKKGPGQLCCLLIGPILLHTNSVHSLRVCSLLSRHSFGWSRSVGEERLRDEPKECLRAASNEIGSDFQLINCDMIGPDFLFSPERPKFELTKIPIL